MNVNELMTTSPMTCRPADSLHDAAQRLWNEDCGSLPVVDGRNRLVGMITDRDIAMAGYLRNRRLAEIRVADTMSSQLTTCAADDSLEDALGRMRETRVRRLPVCDDEGVLHGILAAADVLRAARSRGAKALQEAVLETMATISEARGEKLQILDPKPTARSTETTTPAKPKATTKPAAKAKTAATAAAATKSSAKAAPKASTKSSTTKASTKKKTTRKKR